MVDLAGRTALVTGASRGIGAATARALARAGSAVLLLARDQASAEAVARDIVASGGRALAVGSDVTDAGAVRIAVAQATERFGTVDILINNAGTVQPIGRMADCRPEDWARGVQVNLCGAFNAISAVLPGMLSTGGGTVINISSGAAHRPLEGWSSYCAGKAGLAMLTQSLHLEYGTAGIRAYGFGPGVVDTEMQVEIRASGLNPVSRLARSDLASPERPARLITWLCSDDARDLAGRELSIGDDDLRRRAGVEEA